MGVGVEEISSERFSKITRTNQLQLLGVGVEEISSERKQDKGRSRKGRGLNQEQ